MDKHEMLKHVLEIAKSIVNGEKDPNLGCSKLGEINRDLAWPEELSTFGLLAHEQFDHENIGISTEGCIPEINEECRKFIENIS